MTANWVTVRAFVPKPFQAETHRRHLVQSFYIALFSILSVQTH